MDSRRSECGQSYAFDNRTLSNFIARINTFQTDTKNEWLLLWNWNMNDFYLNALFSLYLKVLFLFEYLSIHKYEEEKNEILSFCEWSKEDMKSRIIRMEVFSFRLEINPKTFNTKIVTISFWEENNGKYRIISLKTEHTFLNKHILFK